jgi:hypothetical protein
MKTITHLLQLRWRLLAVLLLAALALLARKRATHGVPIVFLEPMGNARKLARLLGPEGFNDPGLRFHELTWSNIQINLLDWVGENQAEQESQEPVYRSRLIFFLLRDAREDRLLERVTQARSRLLDQLCDTPLRLKAARLLGTD